MASRFQSGEIKATFNNNNSTQPTNDCALQRLQHIIAMIAAAQRLRRSIATAIDTPLLPTAVQQPAVLAVQTPAVQAPAMRPPAMPSPAVQQCAAAKLQNMPVQVQPAQTAPAGNDPPPPVPPPEPPPPQQTQRTWCCRTFATQRVHNEAVSRGRVLADGTRPRTVEPPAYSTPPSPSPYDTDAALGGEPTQLPPPQQAPPVPLPPPEPPPPNLWLPDAGGINHATFLSLA